MLNKPRNRDKTDDSTNGNACFFCKEHIRVRKSTRKIINIEQKPKIKYFCNSECRINYIRKIQG